MALLGPSSVMGTGVTNDEVFEALVEAQLNTEVAPVTGMRYEVLNFAVGGFSILQQMALVEEGRIFVFDPDLVVVTHHPLTDPRVSSQHIAWLARRGAPISDPTLHRIADSVGVRDGMAPSAANRRLGPHGEAMVVHALTRLRELIANRGLPAILLVMDLPGRPSPPDQRSIHRARELGFDVLDLRDVFEGHVPDSLFVSPTDVHANAKGHRLIADRLFAELAERRSLLTPRLP